MPRTTFALVVVVAVLLLAGCTKQPAEFTINDQVPAEQRTVPEESEGGPAEPAPQADGVFTVEGAALAFASAPPTLPPGEVTITLENNGALPHTVAFEGVEGGRPIVDTNGNDSDTGTVLLEAGTVTYFCDVPGHRQGGMEGTLMVQ